MTSFQGSEYFKPGKGHTWQNDADERWMREHGLDPNTGGITGPYGSVPAGVAQNVQAGHDRAVWEAKGRLGQSASHWAQGALGLLQSFRPGGAAAMESGVYQGLANIDLQRADMLQPLDLLGDFRRHEAHQARKAAKKAARISAIGSAAGAIIGAFAGGPAGAAVGAQAGGALGAGLGGGAAAGGYQTGEGVKPPPGQTGAGGPAQTPPGQAPYTGQPQGLAQEGQPYGAANPGYGQAMQRASGGGAFGGGSGGGGGATGSWEGGAPGPSGAPQQGGAGSPPGGGGQQQRGAGGASGAPGAGGGMAGGGSVGADGNFEPIAWAARAASEPGPMQQPQQVYLSQYVADLIENDPAWGVLDVAYQQEVAMRVS